MTQTNSPKVITEPGIYQISIDDYHADKSWISSTGVKHARGSMAEYRLFLDGYWDNDVKTHFDYGNAMELFLIDKEGFNKSVAVAPTHKWVEEALAENPKLVSPRASKTYKALSERFSEENKDKYIIVEEGEKESFQALQVQAARCFADEYIAQMLTDIDYQSSCYWIDPETGLKMKSRPDIAKKKGNVLCNIKTLTDASPQGFQRKAVELDWPIQACIEIEGAIRTGLMPTVDHYFWLALEKDAPFNVQLYEFNQSDLEVIRDEYRYLLRRIKECTETGVWPGYGDQADNKYGILQLNLPPWYRLKSNQ